MVKNIAFRFDGNNEIGMGHVIRCMNIIRELKTFNINSYIFTKTYSNIKHINDIDDNCIFDMDWSLSVEQEIEEISTKCIENNIQTLVIDNLNSEKKFIIELKKQNINIISFDDQGEGSLYADILINAIVPTVHTYTKTKVYKGNEYIVLNKKFIEKSKIYNVNKNYNNILLSFGGSDPKNISLRALRELSTIDNINITVVIGSAYNYKNIIKDYAKNLKNCNIIYNAKDMGELMSMNDICIISGGITLYETSVVGTPSIVICQVSHQVETARKFALNGIAINLGIVDELKDGDIKNSLIKVLNNKDLLTKMSEKGKKFVDGKGLFRVVNIIQEFIS